MFGLDRGVREYRPCCGRRQHPASLATFLRFPDYGAKFACAGSIRCAEKQHKVWIRKRTYRMGKVSVYYTGIMPPDHLFRTAVALADLPQWSSWPARLLGLQEWNTVERTSQKIEQEYNKEKYALCAQFLRDHPHASPEEMKQFEIGDAWDEEMCVSVGEDLFRVVFKDAWKHYTDEIVRRVCPLLKDVDVVCDLGCGYGYHLWVLMQHFPEKRYWGGEFAQNAVDVAKSLYKKNQNIIVERLDLSDPAFILPFTKDQRVLVLTVYAIEQLPRGARALQRLANIKGADWTIAHFEPVFDWCSESMLGLLRRAYTKANDYNCDLLSTLVANPAVNIKTTEKEFLGLNPLHPLSYIEWR